MLKKLLGLFRKKKAVFLLLLLGLTPLVWFKGDFFIAGGDVFPTLDYSNYVHISSFTWASNVYAGHDTFLGLGYFFPIHLFGALLQRLGMSAVDIQRVLVILFFVLPGISMYYLASVLMRGQRNGWVRFISAIVYMFNFWVVFSSPGWTSSVVYGVAPLLLGLFIKGLTGKEKSTRYAVLFGAASLLIISAKANPPIYVTAGFIIGLYFICHVLLTKGKRLLSDLFFVLKAVFFYGVFNVSWIVPTLLFMTSEQPTSISVAPVTSLAWAHHAASFLNLFRLMGSWALFSTEQGSPYYAYASSYESSGLLILSLFIVPMVAFSTFLFIKKNKNSIIFAVIALISLFLAKGLHPPLEHVNKFLYLHVPYFWLFREPYPKFIGTVALSYSVLVAMLFAELRNRLNKRPHIYKAAVAFLFVISLASSYPLLTGEVVPEKRGILPSVHVKVPQYWYAAGDWINGRRDDFRVFVSPQAPFYQMAFSWGYYGIDLTQNVMNKSLVSTSPGGGYLSNRQFNQLTQLIYDTFQRDNQKGMNRLMCLLNIKYIFQRNDLDYERYDKADVLLPDQVKAFLSNQEGIVFEKIFGKLDLYKISDEYFLPHIYVSP